MANVNIPDLAALTAPAATDEIEVYDASAAANVRLALSYVALLGTANVFTAAQRVNNSLHIRGTTDALLRIGSAVTGEVYISAANDAENAYSLIDIRASVTRVMAGHLLIGTTTDDGQLTVKAGSTSTVGLVVDTAASPTANVAEWRVNGTAKVVVDKDGNVGVGTTGPGSKLDVSSGSGYDTGTTLQRWSHAEPTNYFGFVKLESPAGDPILSFGTYDYGVTYANTLNMVNGHVLIGTTTDSGQLTVLAGSTSTVGLVVDTAASAAARAQSWLYNGVDSGRVDIRSDRSIMGLISRDLGNNIAGPRMEVGRSSNAGAEGPVAGTMNFTKKDDTNGFVWVDASGNLRINSSAPTGSSGSPTVSDTAGTVIGTQTSTLASKILLGGDLTPGEALRTILQTPVKHFKYKSDAYNGSDFHGIIADYSPEFAMDEGRVFNPVSAFGYAVQAIKALTERIQQLEAA
jgi:hypothetical protein